MIDGTARNDGDIADSSLDLDFEAFFLEFELREFRSFHQINNLFNLF